MNLCIYIFIVMINCKTEFIFMTFQQSFKNKKIKINFQWVEEQSASLQRRLEQVTRAVDTRAQIDQRNF